MGHLAPNLLDDDGVSNPSRNLSLTDVVDRAIALQPSRRRLLLGGLGAAALPFLAGLSACGGSDDPAPTTPTPPTETILGITPVATSTADEIVVPAFTGLGAPYWKPDARGAIVGLSRGSTMAHIARAALESIAFQSAALLQAMAKDAAPVAELRVDGGATVKYGRHQIALFHFAKLGKWFACQNLCPHKREMVLSRGLLGDIDGLPKIVCPMHKKSFSLETGEGLSDPAYAISTFPVEIRAGRVYIELPGEEILDQLHLCNPEKVCS